MRTYHGHEVGKILKALYSKDLKTPEQKAAFSFFINSKRPRAEINKYARAGDLKGVHRIFGIFRNMALLPKNKRRAYFNEMSDLNANNPTEADYRLTLPLWEQTKSSSSFPRLAKAARVADTFSRSAMRPIYNELDLIPEGINKLLGTNIPLASRSPRVTRGSTQHSTADLLGSLYGGAGATAPLLGAGGAAKMAAEALPEAEGLAGTGVRALKGLVRNIGARPHSSFLANALREVPVAAALGAAQGTPGDRESSALMSAATGAGLTALGGLGRSFYNPFKRTKVTPAFVHKLVANTFLGRVRDANAESEVIPRRLYKYFRWGIDQKPGRTPRVTYPTKAALDIADRQQTGRDIIKALYNRAYELADQSGINPEKEKLSKSLENALNTNPIGEGDELANKFVQHALKESGNVKNYGDIMRLRRSLNEKLNDIMPANYVEQRPVKRAATLAKDIIDKHLEGITPDELSSGLHDLKNANQAYKAHQETYSEVYDPLTKRRQFSRVKHAAFNRDFTNAEKMPDDGIMYKLFLPTPQDMGVSKYEDLANLLGDKEYAKDVLRSMEHGSATESNIKQLLTSKQNKMSERQLNYLYNPAEVAAYKSAKAALKNPDFGEKIGKLSIKYGLPQMAGSVTGYHLHGIPGMVMGALGALGGQEATRAMANLMAKRAYRKGVGAMARYMDLSTSPFNKPYSRPGLSLLESLAAQNASSDEGNMQ